MYNLFPRSGMIFELRNGCKDSKCDTIYSRYILSNSNVIWKELCTNNNIPLTDSNIRQSRYDPFLFKKIYVTRIYEMKWDSVKLYRSVRNGNKLT